MKDCIRCPICRLAVPYGWVPKVARSAKIVFATPSGSTVMVCDVVDETHKGSRARGSNYEYASMVILSAGDVASVDGALIPADRLGSLFLLTLGRPDVVCIAVEWL